MCIKSRKEVYGKKRKKMRKKKVEKKTAGIQMEILAAAWKGRWKWGREKPGMRVRHRHQHSTPPQNRLATPLGRDGEELQKRALYPRVPKTIRSGHTKCLEEREVAKSKEEGKAMRLWMILEKQAGRVSLTSCWWSCTRLCWENTLHETGEHMCVIPQCQN